MMKFWAIVRNTFLQAIRQPIYSILILIAIAVLVIPLFLGGWTMGSDYHKTDQELLENLGLGTLLVIGLLIAAFTASSVLSREIEDKTALTVIAKPVSRALFVLGKFGGVLLAVAVAYYICSLVFLLVVRHGVRPAVTDPYDFPVIFLGVSALLLTILTALAGNYFFGWTFTSAGVWTALALFSIAMATISVVGKGWLIIPFGHGIRPQLLVGILMLFLAVVIFCAVAITVSTRMGQAMTLLICYAVFFIGQMHAFLFGHVGKDLWLVRAIGWIVPDLSMFDPLDALTHHIAISPGLIGMTALYCVLYTAAMLGIGIALFHGRELESQSSSSTMPGLVGLLAWTGKLAAIFLVVVAVASLPATTAWGNVKLIAALIGGGVAWTVFECFGRGKRWAYWTVLVGGLLALAGGGSALAIDAWRQADGRRTWPVAAMVVAGVVAVILLLPKSRHHFFSSTAGRGPAHALPGAGAADTGSTFAT